MSITDNWVYDTEVYPNIFTIAFEHSEYPIRTAFEISKYRDDRLSIREFVLAIRESGGSLIGFNNIGFDYPILHLLLTSTKSVLPITLYNKAQAIIDSYSDEEDGAKFAHYIYPSDYIIQQIDLYRINHFNNKGRATSLKVLEFNMRMDNIQDLPIPVGENVSEDKVDILKKYNAHDVSATKKFFHECNKAIKLRGELSKKYGVDFTNFDDVKIGSKIFEIALEKKGVQLYEFKNKRKVPRQTKRDSIKLSECILPYVKFEHPEFQRILDWFKSQTITDTKGAISDLTATVNGFEYVFGLGGIHGAKSNAVIISSSNKLIESWDVASYYPNLSIQNNLYPEHLSEVFCGTYKQLFNERKKTQKGSAENDALKLALNGTYGKSNDKFSPFFDPKFTMSITINGQLSLCMLVEELIKVDTVEIIMCNTDGLEYTVHPNHAEKAKEKCIAWQTLTGLALENVRYNRMFIRDVNNYIAEYAEGYGDKDHRVKRKGAYEYKVGWHQNHSALVIPKVAELALLKDSDILETLINWDNKLDFMLRTKVPRTSKLFHGDKQIQNVSRYYIAKGGEQLYKLMPPLKDKTEWRKIGQHVGYGVCVCNDLNDYDAPPIDYSYYEREVKKLVDIFKPIG